MDLIHAESKVQLLLESCAEEIKSALVPIISEESPLLKSAAKTTRGNNFLGYPWTIIDFPRKFENDGFMALRTLCLRGHCFSITLHLSGETLKQCSERLTERANEIPEEYYVSMNVDEWMHIIDEKNYRTAYDLRSHFKEEIEKSSYLKIARKIPFEEAETLPQKAAETASVLFNLLR